MSHLYRTGIRAIKNHLFSKKYLYSVQTRQLKQQEGAKTKIRSLPFIKNWGWCRSVYFLIKHDGYLKVTVFILTWNILDNLFFSFLFWCRVLSNDVYCVFCKKKNLCVIGECHPTSVKFQMHCLLWSCTCGPASC